MNTLTLEFTEYNQQNFDKVMEALKSFTFIKLINSNSETRNTFVISYDEMCKKYPNEWLLIGNPKSDSGKLISGIVLFHHADKHKLALANKNGVLTSNYKLATHVYTGVLAKNSSIGIFKQLTNEKV
jgi:hypothetical protein